MTALAPVGTAGTVARMLRTLLAVAAPAMSVVHAQDASCTVAPTTVDAGGLYTLTYTFKAGPSGFATHGGVRIEIPVAYAETEALLWSAPQTEQPSGPGYVEAFVSSGGSARTPIPVVIEGLLRGIVRAELPTPVPAGARVVLRYRGQAQGLAGQVDVRCQSRRNATDPWVASTTTPRLTVRPARAEFVAVHYPSDAVRGASFDAAVVTLDRYGNRATNFSGELTLQSTDAASRRPTRVSLRPSDSGRVVLREVSFGSLGFQKLVATDPAGRLRSRTRYAMVAERAPAVRHLFGDLHFHTGSGTEQPGFLSASAGTDVNTTATNTFKALNLAGDHRANFTRGAEAYAYAKDVAGLDFASASEHASPLLTPAAWRQVQDIADAAAVPGGFTTFYGFEWTPDLDHHVVVYADRRGQPFGHDRYPDFASLVRALDAQAVPALAIPHVSWPFPEHILWRDTLGQSYQRVGELYSLWNSRHLVQPDDEPQLFEVGGDLPWSFQYAWQRGRRMGVIGASDNHLGHPGADNLSVQVRHAGGLAVVLAPRNDRAAIWDALNARHTYATTGSPIYLDFSADGHQMGSELRAATAPAFTGRVAGTKRLATVEVIRLAQGAYRTVYRAEPNAETFAFTFTDAAVSTPAMYYLRVTQVPEYPGRLYAHSTAEMAWSSPIWVDPLPR